MITLRCVVVDQREVNHVPYYDRELIRSQMNSSKNGNTAAV